AVLAAFGCEPVAVELPLERVEAGDARVFRVCVDGALTRGALKHRTSPWPLG
ncbi:MAG: hypothetical protein JNK82_26845, partial [Myxococcaceae bacterium]|nr:hypothetical protein [Myxococcaceae bacterium]